MPTESAHASRDKLLLLLFGPSASQRRSQTALEGPVGGPQGRHVVISPHLLQGGGDGPQRFMLGPHQGRAAQEDVAGGVGLLPAHRAERGCAARVVALRAPAPPGGRQPDPVSPLGGAGPVSCSELVDV